MRWLGCHVLESRGPHSKLGGPNLVAMATKLGAPNLVAMARKLGAPNLHAMARKLEAFSMGSFAASGRNHPTPVNLDLTVLPLLTTPFTRQCQTCRVKNQRSWPP